MRRLSISLVPVLFLTSTALGYPTDPIENPHPHTTSTIKWEIDDDKDGNAPHNHYSNRNYGFSIFPLESPFEIRSCWDNQSYRLDPLVLGGENEIAHCYVNEGSVLLQTTPNYEFVGSWDADAKARVRDAFAEWNAVSGISTKVGAAIREGSFPSSHIKIYWVDSLNFPGGSSSSGSYNFSSRKMHFRKDRNYSFNKSNAGIANHQYHFYSTALHEVGHAIGFAHSSNSDSVMWATASSPLIGAPKSQNEIHFTSLRSDDKVNLRHVYSIPLPAPTCDDPNIVIRQGQCNLNSSRSFLITGSLPGYTVTNMEYRVKLGAWGTWQTIFNGSLSCAVYNTWSTFFYVKTIFTTPQGVASCTKTVVVFDSCWGGDPQ